MSVGNIIGAGANILGGALGNKAAKSAANAQAQSAQAAIAEQARQYDLTRADTATGRALYDASNNKLMQLLGLGGNGDSTPATAGFTPMSYDQWASTQPSAGSRFVSVPGMINGGYFDGTPNQVATQAGYQQYLSANPARAGTPASMGTPSADNGMLMNPFSWNDLNNDVVYQNGLDFGLNEGRKALEARQRATGGWDSGSALKELTQYGNDYATTKTNDAYNRNTNYKSNIYNMLTGTAGLGQNAVNTGVQAGQTASNNIQNNLMAGGNARSAGIIGGANAWGNALSGVANNIDWGNMFGKKQTPYPTLDNWGSTY